MSETLIFIAPHALQQCISILVSHQRMPGGGGFGLWVDVAEGGSDTHRSVYCKLLFGSGTFRPIAWYTVDLTQESESATRIHVTMTDFNYTMAAGFGVVSVLGSLFVLLSQNSVSSTLILLALFIGFGVFGFFFTRAQHGDAKNLPAAMREWLDGVAVTP